MDIKLKFNPKDIRTKQFSKKVFGYNPDEVDAFLIELSNEFQNLLNKIEQIRSQTPESKMKELVRKTKKKIEKIVEESKKEKRQLEEEKRRIENEIEQLRIVQRKMANKLKLTIIEMTRILEEIKPDDKPKKGKEFHSGGGESSTQRETERNSKSGKREVEDKGDGTA
ncbi:MULTISPECIES: DivIVA domain-containing protein [unclassified Desulfurobacterium]|uniref:DivIVA domain-containing protein n=1 Tax=unclassified Desulfurobacterium TaxID=2639089 RepID=UPI0003B600C5|nr:MULTISPECIES: DivIVA domain-containing protein [unclassified Desulfurobacterium]